MSRNDRVRQTKAQLPGRGQTRAFAGRVWSRMIFHWACHGLLEFLVAGESGLAVDGCRVVDQLVSTR